MRFRINLKAGDESYYFGLVVDQRRGGEDAVVVARWLRVKYVNRGGRE